MQKNPHVPVLLDEVLYFFKNIQDGYILDVTVGFGGHSEALLRSNKSIKLICSDQDKEALNFTKKRLANFAGRVTFDKSNFKDIVEKFKNYPIKGVLADIGVSSYQLDSKDRGFSFESENLDMRMDKENFVDAFSVVNFYSPEKLEYIFKNYGEIRNYKAVVSKIISNRPINSAIELANLFKTNKNKKIKIHPATLIFQAIRIEVNKELDVLKEFLDSIKNNLKDCIVAIISFHSLEDKIVKNTFKNWAKNCICPQETMRCVCGNNNAIGKILTKKPILPSKEEILKNPRSRSARLRVFKIDSPLNSIKQRTID